MKFEIQCGFRPSVFKKLTKHILNSYYVYACEGVNLNRFLEERLPIKFALIAATQLIFFFPNISYKILFLEIYENYLSFVYIFVIIFRFSNYLRQGMSNKAKNSHATSQKQVMFNPLFLDILPESFDSNQIKSFSKRSFIIL